MNQGTSEFKKTDPALHEKSVLWFAFTKFEVVSRYILLYTPFIDLSRLIG